MGMRKSVPFQRLAGAPARRRRAQRRGPASGLVGGQFVRCRGSGPRRVGLSTATRTLAGPPMSVAQRGLAGEGVADRSLQIDDRFAAEPGMRSGKLPLIPDTFHGGCANVSWWRSKQTLADLPAPAPHWAPRGRLVATSAELIDPPKRAHGTGIRRLGHVIPPPTRLLVEGGHHARSTYH